MQIYRGTGKSPDIVCFLIAAFSQYLHSTESIEHKNQTLYTYKSNLTEVIKKTHASKGKGKINSKHVRLKGAK